MRATPHNFVKLLQIEAEDMREDVEAMIRICDQRRERREITEHVHGENMALHRNQLHGVALFQRLLEELEGETFTTIEEVVAAVCTRFDQQIGRTGLFPCIANTLERKLRKVQRTLEAMSGERVTD